MLFVFILNAPIFSQEQDLEMWGLQVEQTNDYLLIDDTQSADLFELSYNLSFTMNALSTVLQEYDEEFVIEYWFDSSNVLISKEWFEHYFSLNNDRERRQAIEEIVDLVGQQ